MKKLCVDSAARNWLSCIKERNFYSCASCEKVMSSGGGCSVSINLLERESPSDADKVRMELYWIQMHHQYLSQIIIILLQVTGIVQKLTELVEEYHQIHCQMAKIRLFLSGEQGGHDSHSSNLWTELLLDSYGCTTIWIFFAWKNY